MSIFARYVFRQAAGSLLLILLSLGAIVWIALALRQLDVVTSQGQDAWLLFKMTTLALPNLMAIVAPFALLISAIHTLNRLNGDSELIVLTAAGATMGTVTRPLLLLAALVLGGVALVNHFAMPWSLQRLHEYVTLLRTNLLSQVMQPGRFTSPEPNLTFHIRAREASGELRGLIMNDARDPKLTQSYLAEHGTLVKQPPSAFLIMTDGHIVRRTGPAAPAQIIAFDKYIVDLDRYEQKQGEGDNYAPPRERYTPGLVAEGERLEAKVKDKPKDDQGARYWRTVAGQTRAELHERFSNPLYPIAFALIALATVGQAQSTRQNRLNRVVTGFLLAAGVRVAGLAANNVVVLNAAATPVLYALPIGAMVLAAIEMRRAPWPKGRSRLSITLAGAAGRVRDAIVASWPRAGRASGA
jgi:lipopolysaccharide export system permease protein